VKHLALLESAGMLFPESMTEIGPGDSLGLGITALLSGVRTYHAYDTDAFADLSMDETRVSPSSLSASRSARALPCSEKSAEGPAMARRLALVAHDSIEALERHQPAGEGFD
jgi:hypothetical protein